MKGHTKSCPNPKCRKIILRYCNFKGEGSFQTKCPHCHEMVEVKLLNESKIEVVKVLLILGLAILPIGIAHLIVHGPAIVACVQE